jgi:steroid delta-isomerase-like uncharacterized protein
MEKHIGIIGAGLIGQTLARHLSKAGYTVLLSNSKGPDTLREASASLGVGVRAVMAGEAALAEVVVLAVPWPKIASAVKGLPAWNNRIVIDANNPILSVNPVMQLAELGGRTSSEVVAELLPGARVVKAFNTLHFKLLGMDPQTSTGRRIIAMSGDDKEAKAVVGEIIFNTGFTALDLGGLVTGGKLQEPGQPISSINLVKADSTSEDAKAIIRRNTEEVQGNGNFELFEELLSPDFVDHTPQPGGFSADKDGVRQLYQAMRTAFPDFHAVIHWQTADGGRVTTYKTYYGTHDGPFLKIQPTGRKINFETVDVMQVQNGQITDHWGVANLLSLMQQLGAAPPITS